MKICIPTTYTFRPQAEIDAEASATGQTNAGALAEAPAQQPANLDTLLDELDSVLARLDELAIKAGNLPVEAAAIQAKHEALTSQELDSVEGIEARSAQMSKLSAMRELVAIRKKKVEIAIGKEQESAIELGTQIAGLLESKWWKLYTARANEIETEFNRLFYRFGLEQNLQDAYKPITLLAWIRPPNFRDGRFTPPEIRITRCRALRQAANKLDEFEKMSFQEIAARIEQIDSEARERARAIRQIGSEQVLTAAGN
jgi:hypothetical protein